MTSNSSDWSIFPYKLTCVLSGILVSFAEFHSKVLFPQLGVAYKRNQMSDWVGWWGISPKSRFLSQNLLHLHTVQVHI